MPNKSPPKITDIENKIYDEYLQNETNKQNLKTINLLLSSHNGLEIINCIAEYLDIAPNETMTFKTKYPGITNVYNSSWISGIYAQETIAAMQEFRNKIRKDEIGNGKQNETDE